MAMRRPGLISNRRQFAVHAGDIDRDRFDVLGTYELPPDMKSLGNSLHKFIIT